MALKSNFYRKIFVGRNTRNIGWNLIGQLLPITTAFLSIPFLLRELGIDKFGLLTIAWMIIGYFSILDLGLGRALTQIVSSKTAKKKDDEIPSIVSTGLLLMFALGVIASIGVVVASNWIVTIGLNVPLKLHDEAERAFLTLAPSIPFVILATGLKGILEGFQKFKQVNLIRIPSGMLTYLAPICIIPYSKQLDDIFLTLLIVRIFTMLGFMYFTVRLGNFVTIVSRRAIKELLSTSGWMTVSNIISPIIVQVDRYLIGAYLSVAAVTSYATPYEAVMKILFIPAAICGATFPVFATLIAVKDSHGVQVQYQQNIKYIAILMLPPVILGVIFANGILDYWLNSMLPNGSVAVFQILLIGSLINGLAHVPFAFVQAAGKPKITASIHVCEMIIYIPALSFAIFNYGILGAAAAWTCRAMFDFCLLNYAAKIIRQRLL